MSGKLDQLAALARMVKDAEILRFGRAVSERRDIENARRSLQEARRNVQRSSTPDAAHLSGQAALWQIWAGQQLRDLNAGLAMAAAREETARTAAARAAGRADVLARLARRQDQKPRG